MQVANDLTNTNNNRNFFKFGNNSEMARQEKQPHGGSLTRPEKGEVLNPHGRPKKLITQLKEIGYHKSQVEDTINAMLTMSRKELEKIDKSEEYTILERIIAGTLLKSHDKNSLFNLDILLNRSHGKPKETIDQTVTEKSIKITLNLNGEG